MRERDLFSLLLCEGDRMSSLTVTSEAAATLRHELEWHKNTFFLPPKRVSVLGPTVRAKRANNYKNPKVYIRQRQQQQSATVAVLLSF